MQTPRWIGLTGRAGSGKSFVAERIAMAGGHSIARFAYALREEIEEVLGVNHAPNLWSKPTSPEVRFILQQYGTNFRRMEDENYWVNKTMAHLDRDHPNEPEANVFDDVRFPNEAIAIQRKGGLIVRVLAPNEVREQRLGQLPPAHASESSMDRFEVDMHITSTDNPAFEGQLNRILVEATYDSGTFLQAIADSLESRG